MEDRILVTRSSMPSLEEYVEEIRPLWESHWLTNGGVEHERLREGLKSYLGISDIELFSNGHSALECAIRVLLPEGGGEIITTPFTFASTANAIVRCGFTPVFADIKPDDLTIDPDSVERLITPRTRAVVPVHVYGCPCDDEAIESIARCHSLKVIYDAAHAFGVKADGLPVASWGDASMLSFHATKAYNTIEGGGVCFNDPEVGDALRRERNFGLGLDGPEVPGGNAKMDEFRSAMGLCNLRHIEGEIAKRACVSERYRERLSGLPGIRLVWPRAGVEWNYAYMPVLFEDAFNVDRDRVFDALAAARIGARKYFYPLVTDSPLYKMAYSSEETPVARDASVRVLCLPMYADLALEDIDRICEVIGSLHRDTR